MKRSLVFASFLAFVMGATPVLADFTYQETTQISGGTILKVMHFVGAFSKNSRQALEPISSTISIKGNRMVNRNATAAVIYDLNQKTLSTVHFADKTYSVITFDQLKQQMAAMAEKMHLHAADQPDLSFDVKVKETGETKDVKGSKTHEMILTFTLSGTDEKNGAQGALDMTSDVWIASNVPGYEEVREFQRRAAEAMGWVPGQNPFLNRPDMAKAMAEMYKEGSKLDGIPLVNTVRMTGRVQGSPSSTADAQPAPQERSDTAPPTSVSDAVAGALVGHFGLGRRKKQNENSSGDPSPSTNGSSSGSCACLMELKSEVTSYNTATVDPTLFDIPSGFTKIDEDFLNATRHR
ncbi:MAG: hypothetical protein JOZ62_19885 [Acidobacteriaceae bacterium]|nr:hypothetical protein [Acidobacteriaceae bacterium]